MRGFAVGRTVFAEPAKAWLGGAIDDEAATGEMAERFGRLVRLFEAARSVRAA